MRHRGMSSALDLMRLGPAEHPLFPLAASHWDAGERLLQIDLCLRFEGKQTNQTARTQ
jgi:hypothetical protein